MLFRSGLRGRGTVGGRVFNHPDPVRAPIEVREGFARPARLRHAVFDWDGTLSFIRAGWGEVMLDLFLAHLPAAPGEDADAWTATHLGGNWSFGLDGKQITGTIGTGAWTPPSLRTYARLSAASISALDAWAASGGSTLSLELDTVPAGEVFIGFFHASESRFVRFGKFGDPMGAGHITLTGLTAPTAGTQLWLSMRSPATSLNFGDAKSAVSVVDLYDMSISAYQVPAPGAAALIGLAGLVARRRRG